MHYKHLNARNEHAHRLVVKADPAAAKLIDALFANSDTPTKTESQLSVQRSWASWSTGVIAAIDFAAVLILLIMILVLGNGMAMATREGTGEYATMRAIGNRTRHIIGLVLAEGFLVASLGVAIGLAVAPATLDAFASLMEKELRRGGARRNDELCRSGVVGRGHRRPRRERSRFRGLGRHRGDGPDVPSRLFDGHADALGPLGARRIVGRARR
jgi:hypothetical protein